jgi:hypothetical protein
MKNIIWLKICALAIFALSISSPSQAFYKKKVSIDQFENPANWNKPYSPGKFLAEMLKLELKRGNRVQLVSDHGSMSKPMDMHEKSSDNYNIEPAIYNNTDMYFPDTLSVQMPDHKMGKPMEKMMGPPWPIELGTVSKKPSLLRIKGSVTNFLPSRPMGSSSLITSDSENAELAVQVQIIHNKTGRLLFEKTFKAFSKLGRQPFTAEMLNMKIRDDIYKPSSINLALGLIQHEIANYITEKVDSVLLEGEIIAVNKKGMNFEKIKKFKDNEEILVNVGKANGVNIGDLFEVHAMSLALHDPYSGNDLGDIYVKTGVIQIVHAWDGFSKAVSLGGKNFKKGFLIRSKSTTGKTNHY